MNREGSNLREDPAYSYKWPDIFELGSQGGVKPPFGTQNETRKLIKDFLDQKTITILFNLTLRCLEVKTVLINKTVTGHVRTEYWLESLIFPVVFGSNEKSSFNINIQ